MRRLPSIFASGLRLASILFRLLVTVRCTAPETPCLMTRAWGEKRPITLRMGSIRVKDSFACGPGAIGRAAAHAGA